MKRCLILARKGFGNVATNPMVGSVIVYKGRIIGEGYHQKYGSAHAEVNAINSVKRRDITSLKKATLYVNLEPCSHFGKTPPCADLILKTGIKYVVIGTIDPNPEVMGRGLQKLVSSGCDVKLGILEDECRDLNKRFFTYYENGRPYIVLKWAETKDKYIGIKGRGQKEYLPTSQHVGKDRIQISGSAAQKLVHQWRGEEQAIMVGTATALADNPRLTVRRAKGSNPIRIVIDRQLKIPRSYHLLDGSVPTLVFTARKKNSKKNVEYIAIDFGTDVLRQIVTRLGDRKIHSVMVEGGTKLLSSLIQNRLWDEARIFDSGKLLRDIAGKGVQGVPSPRITGKKVGEKKVGADRLAIFNRNS